MHRGPLSVWVEIGRSNVGSISLAHRVTIVRPGEGVVVGEVHGT